MSILTNQKNTNKFTTPLLTILIILIISLINPLVFYHYYGVHTKIKDDLYQVKSTNQYNAEYLNHERFIYEAYKNIKNNRFNTLSVIDTLNPLYSFPHFQYYNLASASLLGLSIFITSDIINTYTLGIWLSTLLLVSGTYLITHRLTRSKTTSLLLAFVFSSSPYNILEVLNRSAYPEYTALSCIPMLIYLSTKIINDFRLSSKSLFSSSYIFYSSLLTILSTFFLLTHNITVLLFTTLLAIPFVILIIHDLKKPAKSLLLFIFPITLSVLNVLFYWVPVILNGNNFIISDFLKPFIKLSLQWSSPNILFSVLPFSSPTSVVNTELYVQIGLPLIILIFVFFQKKNIHIYLLIILILILISCDVWDFVPTIFYSIQFPLRLLGFIPFLLIFTAKKLNNKWLFTIFLISLISAFAFYPRKENIYFFTRESFDRFPATNDWSFYQKISLNSQLKDKITQIKYHIILPKPLSSHEENKKFLVEDIVNKTGGPAAATYLLRFRKPSIDKITFNSILDYPENKITRKTSGDINDTYLFSTCLTNATKFQLNLDLQNRDNPQILENLEIQKFDDQSNLYLPNANGFSNATCDYRFDKSDNSFIFNIHNSGSQIILPIFYSQYNKVNYSGNDVSKKTYGYLLPNNRSFTLIDNADQIKGDIKVNLLTNNKLTYASYPSLIMTFILFIISAMTKILISWKKPKTL